ncbi:MAG: hypothetical protein FWC09_04110 [Lachnospiraceae bacterium]|nr:hypothetical protein [Lachnospiraceae bacterium]
MNFNYKIHHLFKSKMLPLTFEHLLAMFPATVLVPLVINSLTNSYIIDTSLVLFTSGIGTIIFLISTKFKIPAYLGSSFAFIGLTAYLVNSFTATDIDANLAYSYIGWTYIFGSVILVVLSFLFKARSAKKWFDFFLPAAMIGPVISLIGLDLAESAAIDAGFIEGSQAANDLLQLSGSSEIIVATVTLMIIILSTITRRKLWKNSAIILGMVGGWLLTVILSDNGKEVKNIFVAEAINSPQFEIPLLVVPPNLGSLFFAVIPVAFVVFTESIGRVTVISQMMENENSASIFSDGNIPKFRATIFSQGIATFVASILGSVPNTLYAENIAVMNTNRLSISEEKAFIDEKDRFIKSCHTRFSVIPYFTAAVSAIAISFSGHLQSILLNIPTPVLGGMKLFLFGIIAAPGMQILVDKRVNYKKISNQLLTASVLISGISGLTIPVGVLELRGMSLGFVVGFVVNIIIKILDYLGRLNDSIEFDELFKIFINEMPDNFNIHLIDEQVYNIKVGEMNDLLSEKQHTINVNGTEFDSDTLMSLISNLHNVKFVHNNVDILRLEKRTYALYVIIAKSNFKECDKFIKAYSNENYHTVEDIGDFIQIRIGESVALRIIKKHIILTKL